jgi:hypothetical protein
MLHEVQMSISQALLTGKNKEAAAFIASAGFSPDERLGIYRNTSIGTLITALRLAYPAIQRLVGADFFEGAAQEFMRETPPRSAWLDAYGEGFADFLERFPPAASLAYLPDVARLEVLVNRALHAPDADPLDLAQLACLDETDAGDPQFVPHPSIGLICLPFPADTIWHAVLTEDDAALKAIDLAEGPVWLLIERRTSGVEILRMSEPTWNFTASLCAGEPLAIVAEAFGADAASLFAEHLAAGRFIRFEAAETLPNSLSDGG